MSIYFQKKAHKRTIILSFFFMLWMSGLIVRLVQLQVFDHPRLKAVVIDQNQNKKPIIPKRGTIYDNEGNILARSLPVQSVYYTPSKGELYNLKLEKINKLNKVLDLSEIELQKLKARIKKDVTFIWIKRKIDPEKEEQLRNLSLSGIYFMEENKRFYPHGKLAAHLLGRVNIDETGASGIEYKYDSILKGKEGEHLILKDAKKREYRFEILREPEPGKDLFLTIDETIQYYTEKALEKAMLKTGAKWGTVIVARPSTGEILAMANYPTYDLNNLPPMPTVIDRNQAVHHNFEPGSTFKIVTASAALEANRTNLYDSFDCSKGYIYISGKAIRDHKRFGVLSFPEVIIHSSNVGTIQIGQSLDKERFYRTIKAFGFGQKTGIDLPAEESGIFRPLDTWSRISPASLSIGYEISVTAIQMLQTINIIANRGVALTPRIIKNNLRFPNTLKKKLVSRKRILSKGTASELVSILEGVVQEGTGTTAQIRGYTVAGKTGTAQKFDPSTGRYSFTAHMASFVGFAPVDDPAFSMVVVIDDPQGQYYGAEVAAPVFREIASQSLRYLRIPQQEKSLNTIIADNRRKQRER